MHSSTFEYLKPTDEQIKIMAAAREAAKVYAEALDQIKHTLCVKYVLQQCGLKFQADGTPR